MESFRILSGKIQGDPEQAQVYLNQIGNVKAQGRLEAKAKNRVHKRMRLGDVYPYASRRHIQ